ncbi:MAG: dipicolinate synthase subunit DpsA [Clostridia bacterium]|nr:dipicolinate synthase subunit DpsA [Clostridia bacterium]
MENNKILVVGGDNRLAYLAESLIADKNEVTTFGLEKSNLDNKYKSNSLTQALKKSDYVVLCIPVSRDNKTIYSPFSDTVIPIDQGLFDKLKNKIIFCGLKDKLFNINSSFKKLNIIDYAANEEFLLKNAALTAEGAISILIKEYKNCLFNSNCLISGYGRIGKILAHKLSLIGAKVTILARNKESLLWAEIMGYNTLDLNNLNNSFDNYDIIVNTVPYLIFDKKILNSFKKKPYMLDLASVPGGIDFKEAKKLDICVNHALGIPSEFSPKAASDIIKNIIYKNLT